MRGEVVVILLVTFIMLVVFAGGIAVGVAIDLQGQEVR